MDHGFKISDVHYIFSKLRGHFRQSGLGTSVEGKGKPISLTLLGFLRGSLFLEYCSSLCCSLYQYLYVLLAASITELIVGNSMAS